MKIKSFWNTVVITLAATSLWTVAQGCGPSIGSFCNKVCDCMGCSDSEQDDCVDSLEDAKKDAEDGGCGSQFNDYLSCSSSEMECKDDVAVADGCDSEAEKLAECAKSSVLGGGGSVDAYCGELCDCQGCDSSTLQSCKDSVGELELQADDAGCTAEFDDYLVCVAASAECQGGELVLQGCEAEANDFSNCFSGGSSGSGGAGSGSGGSGGGF